MWRGKRKREHTDPINHACSGMKSQGLSRDKLP